MRSGDFLHTPAGHQWTIAFVVRSLRLPSGRHVFALRVIDEGEQETVLMALLSEDEALPHWVGDTEIDERDVFDIEGDYLAVHRQKDLLVSLRDEDGGFKATWRWRVALSMLRGRDIGPDAIWRSALPEEI